MRDDDPSDVSSVAVAMRRSLGCGRIAGLAARHLDSGGSRMRARLGLDTARHLGLAADIAVAIAAAAELLHNAALIHDDIQDRDPERRGAPALWVRDGIGPALCAGDLMISAASAVLGAVMPDAGLRAALAMMHAAVAETIAGQDADLAASRDVSFADWEAIAARKSGPLIALPVRLALLAARAPGDARAGRAARALAVGYQIVDDLRDLSDDRRAGRPNAVLALASEGAGADRAVAHARGQLDTAEAAARAIPDGAGLPLAALSDRVRRQLGACAHAA